METAGVGTGDSWLFVGEGGGDGASETESKQDANIKKHLETEK
jgi:hypothetical protein